MSEIIIEGLTATVIGMGMVFGVLAILCVILSFFKYITPQEAKKPKTEPEADTLEADEDSETDVAEFADDSELVAVISAAIAAYVGEGAKIASIKRAAPVRASYKGWTAAAIREGHRGLY